MQHAQLGHIALAGRRIHRLSSEFVRHCSSLSLEQVRGAYVAAGQRILKGGSAPSILAIWVCLRDEEEFDDFLVTLGGCHVQGCAEIVVAAIRRYLRRLRAMCTRFRLHG
jgi:hypothetical protein